MIFYHIVSVLYSAMPTDGYCIVLSMKPPKQNLVILLLVACLIAIVAIAFVWMRSNSAVNKCDGFDDPDCVVQSSPFDESSTQ